MKHSAYFNVLSKITLGLVITLTGFANENWVPDPTSPSLSYGWIGLPEAWKINQGSRDVVVAVVDSGVDYMHADLVANMWHNPNPQSGGVVGYNFAENNPFPYPYNAHGTAVAGLIGAVGGNGLGMSGVSPRVSIMALKVDMQSLYNGNVEAYANSIANSISYAVSNKAKIINVSLGFYFPRPVKNPEQILKPLQQALAYAEQKRVLVVLAAGNDNTGLDGLTVANVINNHPSRYIFPFSVIYNGSNQLVVTATHEFNGDEAFECRATSSYCVRYGARSVHLAAPASFLPSTAPGNTYTNFYGTSAAAAIVSGAAALLWAEDPTLTVYEVKQILMGTVDRLPSLAGRVISNGRVNILRALQWARARRHRR